MKWFVRVIASLGVLLLAASCGASPRQGSSNTTTPSSGSVPTVSTTGPTVPSATSSSAPEAVNLVATPEVRRAIEQAYSGYVAGKIPFNIGYIAGEAPRTVYYGYYAPTATYWAFAELMPSQAAIDRYHQLPPNSVLNPLIFFQDGPYIFARPAGGQWHFVTDTGGALCSPPLPEKLLVVWSISPADSSCPRAG